MGAIVAAVLFAAGVRVRLFAAPAVSLRAARRRSMVLTSANRLGRLDVWLGTDTDPFGAARQPIHGRYALADGGWWGVGLGASREKWQWLSEPHNDFIFAIIGEELGLPGHARRAGAVRRAGAGLLPARRRAPTTSSSGSPRPA